MRSIKGSKFITIDSGEQSSVANASSILLVKAKGITKSLSNLMPVKLVKVEIISFDRDIPHNQGVDKVQIWLATGLMVKL